MSDGGHQPDPDQEQITQIGLPPERPAQMPDGVSLPSPPQPNLRPVGPPSSGVPQQATPDQTQVFDANTYSNFANTVTPDATTTSDFSPTPPVVGETVDPTQVQMLAWDTNPQPQMPTPPSPQPAPIEATDGGQQPVAPPAIDLREQPTITSIPQPSIQQPTNAQLPQDWETSPQPQMETPAPPSTPDPQDLPTTPPAVNLQEQPTATLPEEYDLGNFEQVTEGQQTQRGGPPPTPPLRKPPPGPAPTLPPGPPSFPKSSSDPVVAPEPQTGPGQFVPPMPPTATTPAQFAPPSVPLPAQQPPPQSSPVAEPAFSPPAPSPSPVPAPAPAPPTQAGTGAETVREEGGQSSSLDQTPATKQKAVPLSLGVLDSGSLLMPMLALALALVAMSVAGLARYDDRFSTNGSFAFFRDLTGFWPALLLGATVALALATSGITQRARNAFVVASACVAVPSCIHLLQVIWRVLFNGGGRFRAIPQTFVLPTGQAILLCLVAAGAAIVAVSNREKAQQIITLGLVGVPALGVLASPRIWGGGLPQLGFFDQVTVLLVGFGVSLATGLLIAAIANALRPTTEQLRMMIMLGSAVTLGVIVLRELTAALGDGQSRFFGAQVGDSRIAITLCALALILSLLKTRPLSAGA